MVHLLDQSGAPIRPIQPAKQPEPTPAPAANPLAHLANPALAAQLRQIADMVEQGTVFSVTFIGLGVDEQNPRPLTLIHEHTGHRGRVLGELSVVHSLIAKGEVEARYFPKPMFADGTPAPQGDVA